MDKRSDREETDTSEEETHPNSNHIAETNVFEEVAAADEIAHGAEGQELRQARESRACLGEFIAFVCRQLRGEEGGEDPEGLVHRRDRPAGHVCDA